MAQRFRRPCSPPATKSNPAKPFSSSTSFRTISSPQAPPPTLSLNRQPHPQEKSPVLLAPRLIRLSLPRLLQRLCQTAPTRRPMRLRHPRQSKIDPPSGQSPPLPKLQHPARHSLRVPASPRYSASAVGPFTRFQTVGKSRKVLAFNKM